VGRPAFEIVPEEPREGQAHARPRGRDRRVLAVFEPGATGDATLREAAELAEAGSELSVVTLAPQVRPPRCCGKGGTGPYNIAVREEAEVELRQARDILGACAGRASFTVLVGHPSPPFTAWVQEHAFDLVLLPGHRFTRSGNRFARAIQSDTSAEVRVVA
jgi:hypothetical protein